LVRVGVGTAFISRQSTQARGSARSSNDGSLNSQSTVVLNHTFVEWQNIAGRSHTGTSGVRRAFAVVKSVGARN